MLTRYYGFTHEELDFILNYNIKYRMGREAERLNEEIALNIGPGETLVGIEILDAREVLGQGQLPSVTLENIPLAEVA